MKACEVIQELDEEHWATDVFKSLDGRYCAAGWLMDKASLLPSGANRIAMRYEDLQNTSFDWGVLSDINDDYGLEAAKQYICSFGDKTG